MRAMSERAANSNALSPGWSLDDARELYQIEAWGRGFFGINEAGHVTVRPGCTVDREIDLFDVVQGLRERDLHAPLLIRFSDILVARLKELQAAFAGAMRENDYTGRYTAVYPIKVNQQRPVVEEVMQHGPATDFGLEVGSKPELLAVMALTAGEPERLIICNGFKDDGYIEAVVLATKLGRRIIPVVEKPSELHLLIKHAKRYEVRPIIGVRVKLAAQGAGRWRESAGMRSKFGLTLSEVLAGVRLLEAEDMLDCLKLVHCHPGSQIHDIRRLKDAIAELAHVYGELVRLGAPMEYLDVGGGLGVDYDGSQTNFRSSMNYSLAEYASEVVYRIASVCNEREIAHPTILSESGRAIAAYQSVLVFNVLGSTSLVSNDEEPSLNGGTAGADEEIPQPIRDLMGAHESLTQRRLVECYHDAVQARDQVLHLFSMGYLSLEERSLGERLFWAICKRAWGLCQSLPEIPEELEDLETILSEIYFCNFSVFQSLPDSWAIGQLFPILPIHRLDTRPTRKAVLADITCDSDGKVDRFVDQRDVNRTLDVHQLEAGQEYYLAAFLVGAYQETLGDLHNLFGDTHVVHISLHDEGGWWIEETVRGDTAKTVLGYVQYDADRLLPKLTRDCEQAVRAGRMTLSESQALRRFYESELNGYTYLEPD
jgi:arginine decarboxylase